jgi:2-iminobutanoate/2-iminopropanoate deaminase
MKREATKMGKAIIRVPPEKLWHHPGAYSHGTVVEVKPGTKLLFLSGAIARDTQGNRVGLGDMQAQLKQALENIRTVMEEAGGTLNDVVQLRIYTPRIEEYHKTIDFRRKEFPELFGEKPGDGPEKATAITLIGVTRLASEDILIEIEAIAAV